MNYRKHPLSNIALLLAGLISSALYAQAQPDQAASSPDDSRSWFGQLYAPAPAGNYGLLGQSYAGLDYSYVHQDTASPAIEHKYSFISSMPLETGLDGAVKYDYLTGSLRGQHNYENNVVAAGTGYLPMEWGKPFLSGEAGWAWEQKFGKKADSFSWAGVAGMEFQLLPPVVLTPYVKYEDRAHLSEHDWDYGVKATYRFGLQWSANLGFQINDHKDTEYLFGLNRHF